MEFSLLYVEDERLLRDITSRCLRRLTKEFRLNLRIATNGGDAMDLIDEEKFDLVVTDFSLGKGHNGRDVAIHADNNEMKVVVNSSNPNQVGELPDHIQVRSKMTARQIFELIKIQIGLTGEGNTLAD